MNGNRYGRRPILLRVCIAALLGLSILVCTSLPVQSQAEIVPADHRVYDFLYRMQVRGLLAGNFISSALPYDRKEVAALLDTLAHASRSFSSAERSLFNLLASEFSFELGLPIENRVSVYHEGPGSLISDRQKYLFRYEDPVAAMSVNLRLGLEPQFRRSEGTATQASLLRMGGGFSGTFDGWLGFSLAAMNGFVAGSRGAALQNIEVRRTYKINEPDSRFFDETTGYLRIRNDWGSLTVGRNRLVYGTGPAGTALWFSNFSPEMDHIGIRLQYRGFTYNFFHGWLIGDRELVALPEAGFDTIIQQKYVSFHRIGLSVLRNRLNLAFSEIIVYGERGVELAYLNPFVFLKSVEHSQQDRDKAMLGFEIRGIPIGGTEVYGDLLIDDLAFEKLGTDSYVNQFAFRLGGSFIPSWVLPDLLVSFDYVRIQPYVYSHRLVRNKFTHNGFPLGNPTGPNSEASTLFFNYIFNGRISADARFFFVRKGHNVTDEGVLIRNVGGDIAIGFRHGDSEQVRFLDGNLERIRGFGIHLKFEIIRQLFLRGGYEMNYREETWKNQTFYDHFMFGEVILVL